MPTPVNLPNSGIELGSPALQADSLPTEISGKPLNKENETQRREVTCLRPYSNRVAEMGLKVVSLPLV